MSDSGRKTGLVAEAVAQGMQQRRGFLRIAMGAGVATLGSSLLVACGGGGDDTALREQPKVLTDTECGPKTYNLYAGQTNLVGTVTVTNTATDLIVTYALSPEYVAANPNASFGALHLWVGDDLATLPKTPTGVPIPGQFPYKDEPEDLIVQHTRFTFTIPLANLNVDAPNTAACDPLNPPLLNVVAHAVVFADLLGSPGSHETAFAGPYLGSGPRWWFYGQYYLCCTPEMVLNRCETAFAYGGYVFTTDRKSNPDGLASLNLTKNRWGWANNIAPGRYSYPIYAGAGLNNTSKGTNVGVLNVIWTGTTLTLAYDLAPGYMLTEAHVYADGAAPTTLAPGQYGHTAYFDPAQNDYTYSVGVSSANGQLWLIAHAVVCWHA